MSASPIRSVAVAAHAADDFSRLAVPEPQHLAEDVRALVERHHGDHWIRALSLNPDTARRFSAYFESLFGHAGRLPLAERELIAVVVSAENGCGLCEIHHTRALGELLGSGERAQRIALDHHLVPLSRREQALLEFALKVTRTPKAVTRADFEALRAAGFDEEESLEALETISWFNHTNRIFISLGVVPDAKYFAAG